ncbi:hypothetical protein B2J93_5695 [Marssonina coronariae]|uniref:Cytochrome P450 n=1 Tax=Diplocarpon coronariae TaxID=2795749 RepID=A0A218ZBX3_9HELO|nr:hypothetical protein B2J93_5695 [Marssonina coronariae]
MSSETRASTAGCLSPAPTASEPRTSPSILRILARDTVRRLAVCSRLAVAIPIAILHRVPQVRAVPQYSDGERLSLYNTTAPDADSQRERKSQGSGLSFSVAQWDARGTTIRAGGTIEFCLGNLSMAIDQLTRVNAAEYNGAAGALSLLPTAGALIGAPTKELWVVTKLMPLAGILSMLLSLGGSMVPSTASEYNPSDTYTYEGMMSTASVTNKHVNITEQEVHAGLAAAESRNALRDEVLQRVQTFSEGGGSYLNVWIGLAFQLVFVAALILTLWYAQLGAVIPWWCQAREWMYYWYLIVAISSLLENFSGVPFTYQTTLRISKAPAGLELPRNLTRITPTAHELSSNPSLSTIGKLRRDRMNTRSVITLPGSYAWNRNCFYVVLSVEQIKTWHASLRVFSKAFSVGVYAVGTALFASAQFVSITIALMTLCMVLGTAVLGRVLSLWMARSLMSNDPIIHKIVRDDAAASRELDMIFAIEGLQVEVLGHIVVDGYSVTRRYEWLTISKYIGVCAGPYEFYADVILGGQYTFEIARMHVRYGPIIRINPFELHVSTADFYAKLYSGPGKRRRRWNWFTAQFGLPESMVGTDDPDSHRIRRAALHPFFSNTAARKLQPIIDDRAAALLRRCEEFQLSRPPMNLTYVSSALTNDIAPEYAFARSDHRVEHPGFERTFHDAELQERIAPDETRILNDGQKNWHIPPGIPVGMTSVLVHHDESVFPDSRSFLPERWIGHPHLDRYLVSFSRGSRMCIGVHFAHAELYITMARIFQAYGSKDMRLDSDQGYLELFETTRDDVELRRDAFIPVAKAGSEGVRINVKKGV